MDCSISPNYQNISFSFRLKFWEVSSAIHISSGIEVSIWKFIYSDINSNYSETEILSFIAKYRNSLIASQHIHHFNILRIFEISSEDDPLSFSSERITKSLSLEKNLTSDEAYFMLSQLCVALDYLHNDLHAAHLAILPDNILLSPHFNLKLANLVHYGKFSNYDSPIEPNLYPLNSSIFDIDPQFASPEIKNKQPLTSYSDVYSFALFLIYVFTNKIPTKFPIDVKKLNIPDDLKKIVDRCLFTQPNQRPTFKQLLQSPSLNPVTVRVLNFIPQINEGSFEVRENFFEKLSGIISNYSSRILSLKFVPIITKEITEDKELTNQLLPILLLAAEKINPLDNYKLIFQPLFKIEQCANYFFEKALTMTDASIFIPILISTYKSNFKSIASRRNELLKSINALENINSIICLIENLDDPVVIESVLLVLEDKIEISESSLFIRQLNHLYKRFDSNTSICTSISHSLLKLQPNSEYAPKAVSLSLRLTSSSIPKKEKQELIQFVEKFLVLIRQSVESEPAGSSMKINLSKSSNQILLFSFDEDEDDDDAENISGRKGKKKHRNKKEKKSRRSSLANSNLKELQLDSSRNNTFSNSQKLFNLPRGINPLSLKNPFIREIDQFSFREYINADNPPFKIKDNDPFEVVSENCRRMSEIVNDSCSSSNNEEAKQTAQENAENYEKRSPKAIDRSHRRSMSSQSLSAFPNFNEMNQMNPFSAKNSNLQLNLAQIAEERRNKGGLSEDDSSGPFKVSSKNTFVSSGGKSIERSASTKISSFNFAMAKKKADDSKPNSARKPSYDDDNDIYIVTKQPKPKRSKQKNRPMIPTPPKKTKKINNDD